MIEYILYKIGILHRIEKNKIKEKSLPYLMVIIENLAILMISIIYYFLIIEISITRIIFFILLLIFPDISMFAYIISNKVGSYLYNFFHTYLIPLIIILIAHYISYDILIDISLIWIIHIAQDRFRGMGFKYKEKYNNGFIEKI